MSREIQWEFEPRKEIHEGAHVAGGDVVGLVKESVLVKHRILVPPTACGTVTYVAPKGNYTVNVWIKKIVFNKKILGCDFGGGIFGKQVSIYYVANLASTSTASS